MKQIILSLVIMTCGFKVFAQYAPSAGKPGSTAINKDSSIFKNWAKQCSIYRGWKNIAQKDSGFTTVGDSLSAIGRAGENGVVSLGDSGIAICQFSNAINDGPGWDFAVFENSFEDMFLELAFVEVSSDGWRFFRIPCHSLTDTLSQTWSFGSTDPEKINNLAGKYRAGFGTPFDISDIPDYKDLKKYAITHVKIIDVVGSLNPVFASYDTANRKINDPWPTVFPSGGFDLDAIGIIHEQPGLNISGISNPEFINGPNPVTGSQKLVVNNSENTISKIEIYTIYGHLFKEISVTDTIQTIEAGELPMGLFFIHLSGSSAQHTYKGLKL